MSEWRLKAYGKHDLQVFADAAHKRFALPVEGVKSTGSDEKKVFKVPHGGEEFNISASLTGSRERNELIQVLKHPRNKDKLLTLRLERMHHKNSYGSYSLNEVSQSGEEKKILAVHLSSVRQGAKWVLEHVAEDFGSLVQWKRSQGRKKIASVRREVALMHSVIEEVATKLGIGKLLGFFPEEVVDDDSGAAFLEKFGYSKETSFENPPYRYFYSKELKKEKK